MRGTRTQLRSRGWFALIREVFRRFYLNQGYLLAGALAYYILLSILPLTVLTLIALADYLDEAALVHLLEVQLHTLFPAAMDQVVQQVRKAYQSRALFGTFGVLSLIFFSSLMFRTLQRIMVVFFGQPPRTVGSTLRNFVVPYLFLLIYFTLSLAFTLADEAILALKHELPAALLKRGGYGPMLSEAVKLFSAIANFTLLILFYKIMPKVKIKWRHAVVGAVVMGGCWVGAKTLLVIFYTQFSSVSMIFGALTSLFILLISLEVFSLILLFGAQVIAVYRDRDRRPLRARG